MDATKCERCGNGNAPVAEYILEKVTYTRRTVLCQSCRDVTAQIYPLEAVESEPIATVEAEAPEATEESESPTPEPASPELEGDVPDIAAPAKATRKRRGNIPRQP